MHLCIGRLFISSNQTELLQRDPRHILHVNMFIVPPKTHIFLFILVWMWQRYPCHLRLYSHDFDHAIHRNLIKSNPKLQRDQNILHVNVSDFWSVQNRSHRLRTTDKHHRGFSRHFDLEKGFNINVNQKWMHVKFC